MEPIPTGLGQLLLLPPWVTHLSGYKQWADGVLQFTKPTCGQLRSSECFAYLILVSF